jgi:hypothetical protein
VKSPRLPLLRPFSVIPAQAGIQGFQSLALGPRFRGDDDFGWTAGFLHSLAGRDPGRRLLDGAREGVIAKTSNFSHLTELWIPAFAGMTGVGGYICR